MSNIGQQLSQQPRRSHRVPWLVVKRKSMRYANSTSVQPYLSSIPLDPTKAPRLLELQQATAVYKVEARGNASSITTSMVARQPAIFTSPNSQPCSLIQAKLAWIHCWPPSATWNISTCSSMMAQSRMSFKLSIASQLWPMAVTRLVARTSNISLCGLHRSSRIEELSLVQSKTRASSLRTTSSLRAKLLPVSLSFPPVRVNSQKRWS